MGCCFPKTPPPPPKELLVPREAENYNGRQVPFTQQHDATVAESDGKGQFVAPHCLACASAAPVAGQYTAPVLVASDNVNQSVVVVAVDAGPFPSPSAKPEGTLSPVSAGPPNRGHPASLAGDTLREECAVGDDPAVLTLFRECVELLDALTPVRSVITCYRTRTGKKVHTDQQRSCSGSATSAVSVDIAAIPPGDWCKVCASAGRELSLLSSGDRVFPVLIAYPGAGQVKSPTNRPGNPSASPEPAGSQVLTMHLKQDCAPTSNRKPVFFTQSQSGVRWCGQCAGGTDIIIQRLLGLEGTGTEVLASPTSPSIPPHLVSYANRGDKEGYRRPGDGEESKGPSLLCGSWNLRGGSSPDTRRVVAELFAKVDVLALQEVSQDTAAHFRSVFGTSFYTAGTNSLLTRLPTVALPPSDKESQDNVPRSDGVPSEVGVTGGVGAGDVDAEGPLLSRPPPPPVEVLTPPQKRRGRPALKPRMVSPPPALATSDAVADRGRGQTADPSAVRYAWCSVEVVVGVGHSLRVTSFHIPPSVPEKGRFGRAAGDEKAATKRNVSTAELRLLLTALNADEGHHVFLGDANCQAMPEGDMRLLRGAPRLALPPQPTTMSEDMASLPADIAVGTPRVSLSDVAVCGHFWGSDHKPILVGVALPPALP